MDCWIRQSGWMGNPDLTVIETKGDDKGLPNQFTLKVTLKSPNSTTEEGAAEAAAEVPAAAAPAAAPVAGGDL